MKKTSLLATLELSKNRGATLFQIEDDTLIVSSLIRM